MRLKLQPTDSAVPTRAVLEPGDPTYRTFRETRYERIGGPIATLRVGVVGVEGGSTRWIELTDKPGTSYLNPLGWDGNSDEVLVDKFSRSRDAREVLLANHRTGAITKAYAETDPAWVDMETGGLEWIRGGQTFYASPANATQRYLYRAHLDGTGTPAHRIGQTLRLFRLPQPRPRPPRRSGHGSASAHAHHPLSPGTLACGVAVKEP